MIEDRQSETPYLALVSSKSEHEAVKEIEGRAMPDAVPTPAAVRQQRCQREYRERDKAGTLWASAFVPSDLAERLIEGGLLPEDESTDKKSLGTALVEAARRWAKSVIP